MTGERTHNRGGVTADDQGADIVPCRGELAHRPPSRAVSGNRSSGSARVFVVRPDGFDHEIEFVGAVDLSGNAVILA